MSIETGVSSSMASIIIALCVLFVVGVGIGEAKHIKKKDKKFSAEHSESSKKEDAIK